MLQVEGRNRACRVRFALTSIFAPHTNNKNDIPIIGTSGFCRMMYAERLQAGMKKHSLAALVATMPENVTYSSSFWAMRQWIRRGLRAYVLVPSPEFGDSVVFGSPGLVDLTAEDEVWVRDVCRFGKFSVNRTEGVALSQQHQRIEALLLAREDDGEAVEALVSAIKERGLQRARIGVDEIGVLPQYWDALVEALPGATFVRAADVFRYARAIKAAEEVSRLRRSAQIADLLIEAALDVAREGVAQFDLAKAFRGKTAEEGGQPVLGCVGIVARSAMVNVQPSMARLRAGDVIRFDAYRHYRWDIARNGVLCEPTQKIRTYRSICAGLDRATSTIKPGVKVADVFDAAVETVQREGIPHHQCSHLGYGIGLDGYDAPNIVPSSVGVFEESPVICVETPYYEMGFAGLQVEDTMVVTRDGVDSFMLSSATLRVV